MTRHTFHATHIQSQPYTFATNQLLQCIRYRFLCVVTLWLLIKTTTELVSIMCSKQQFSLVQTYMGGQRGAPRQPTRHPKPPKIEPRLATERIFYHFSNEPDHCLVMLCVFNRPIHPGTAKMQPPSSKIGPMVPKTTVGATKIAQSKPSEGSQKSVLR